MSMKERPHGKDGRYEAGIEIDGTFYSNLEIVKTIAKLGIQKGLWTKVELKTMLVEKAR